MKQILIFVVLFFVHFSVHAQRYPSGASPSISLTGQLAPLYADFIGAVNPAGNLVGIKVSTTGHLLSDSLTSYYLDGVSTNVSLDTVVSSNSRPLPAVILDSSGDFYNLATELTLSNISTKLTSIDSSLISIDGKIPALGQATMLNSLPVVIASDQSAVPVSVVGVATEATLALVKTATEKVANSTAADGAATPAFGMAIGGQDGGGNFRHVLTDSTGRVSVNVNNSALPTGAATETTLSAINTKILAAGQATMAASSPVVIASNQSAVPVSGTFFQATQPVSAVSLPLPTGAATEAKQDAGNTSLSNIDAKLPASLGQKLTATSLAVVLPSDYSLPAPAVPFAVTVKQAAITVGTTAVRLTTDAAAPSSTRRRLEFQLDQDSTAICRYGSSTVTSAGATRGVVVYPAATTEMLNDANDYYLICDTAAQTVYITEAE